MKTGPWKLVRFPIPFQGLGYVNMPARARILSVGLTQASQSIMVPRLSVWAAVDTTESRLIKRVISVRTDDDPMLIMEMERGKFLGTISDGRTTPVHVFEFGEKSMEETPG